MSTTELYFEYVVIGFETLLWILLLFFSIIGEGMIKFIKYGISNLLTTAIIICACYILGLITDRVADKIFEKRKNKIKNEFTTKAQTSLIIWEKHSEFTYAKFTLSRIRILRSSILNCIIIGSFATYISLIIYKNIKLSIAIVLLSILLSYASSIGHTNLLRNYYQKTSALERGTSQTIIRT